MKDNQKRVLPGSSAKSADYYGKTISIAEMHKFGQDALNKANDAMTAVNLIVEQLDHIREEYSLFKEEMYNAVKTLERKII